MLRPNFRVSAIRRALSPGKNYREPFFASSSSSFCFCFCMKPRPRVPGEARRAVSVPVSFPEKSGASPPRLLTTPRLIPPAEASESRVASRGPYDQPVRPPPPPPVGQPAVSNKLKTEDLSPRAPAAPGTKEVSLTMHCTGGEETPALHYTTHRSQARPPDLSRLPPMPCHAVIGLPGTPQKPEPTRGPPPPPPSRLSCVGPCGRAVGAWGRPSRAPHYYAAEAWGAGKAFLSWSG